MTALKSDWRFNMEKKITLSKQIIIGVVFAVLEFSMVVLNKNLIVSPEFNLHLDLCGKFFLPFVFSFFIRGIPFCY